MARNREVCDLMHDMLAASNMFFDVGYMQMEEVLDDIFDLGKRFGSIYSYSRMTETTYFLRIMFSFENNFHYFSYRNHPHMITFKLDMRNPRDFARSWYIRLCDYAALLRRTVDAEAERIAENEARLISDLRVAYQIPIENAEDVDPEDPFGLLQNIEDDE